MNKTITLISCLLLIGMVYAQSDSSFVSILPLNSSIHPIWGLECCGLGAGNVFLDYNGCPVMQGWMIYNADPPPGSGDLAICSPFMVFSQSGQYLYTAVPQHVYQLLNFSRIERTGDGDYLAFNAQMSNIEGFLMRLDAGFNPVQNIELSLDSGLPYQIRDVLQNSGQYVAWGYSNSEGLYILAGFDLTGAEIWHRSFVPVGGCIDSTLGVSTQGNIYLHVCNNILITNSSGDSLAYREISGIVTKRIFQKNDNYYAVEASSNILKIYDLGLHAVNTTPQTPLLEIPVRYSSSNVQFSVINTSDGGFAFLVQSPLGEVQKYNASFSLEWASDNVDYEKISDQHHPLIELDNGDFLYACGISQYLYDYHPDQFALVRITAEGVPLDDELAQKPERMSLYPNPCSQNSKISFKLNQPESCELKVYNLRGQLIKTLLSEAKQTGVYNISWDGTDYLGKQVGNGVYFIRLQAGNQYETAKLLRIK